MITEPGIYDIPPAEYHADPCPEPSLSSSLAKKLCLESPLHAMHAHPRLNPLPLDDDHDEKFDIGTAAHALLLEGTSALAVIDAKDWRTKDAKAQRDAAYAAGQTPMLVHRWAAVQAMVAATRAQLAQHTDGGAAMFTKGRPEQTLVWIEDDGSSPVVWCRARLDWVRPCVTVPGADGRLVIVDTPADQWAIDDFKTTSASAEPDAWTRSIFFAGTDLQVAWYLRGVKALTGKDATFRFAVQETFPPYALSVISLGPAALMLAEKKVRYALEVWREAHASKEWIGYPRRTCYASLPQAHETWWLEKEMR